MHPLGALYLIFFGILIPTAVIRNRRQMQQPLTKARHLYFRDVVIQQVLLTLLAVMTAYTVQIPLRVGRIDPVGIAVACGVLIVLVLLMRPVWRRAVSTGDSTPQRIAPRNAEERWWWIAVSFSAGIGEEIVWRGVFTALLWWLLDNWWVAAGVSAAVFGIAHAHQGLRKTIVITGIAAVCQLLVWWSGGLALAMFVHTGYDIAAGLTYGQLMRPETRD